MPISRKARATLRSWSNPVGKPWIRKRWNEQLMVIYEEYDTQERGRTVFWKGPGLWEVRARMVEKGPSGSLELSTTKTSLTVYEPEPPKK